MRITHNALAFSPSMFANMASLVSLQSITTCELAMPLLIEGRSQNDILEQEKPYLWLDLVCAPRIASEGTWRRYQDQNVFYITVVDNKFTRSRCGHAREATIPIRIDRSETHQKLQVERARERIPHGPSRLTRESSRERCNRQIIYASYKPSAIRLIQLSPSSIFTALTSSQSSSTSSISTISKRSPAQNPLHDMFIRAEDPSCRKD